MVNLPDGHALSWERQTASELGVDLEADLGDLLGSEDIRLPHLLRLFIKGPVGP